jgi:hypothetical protein
MVPVVSCIGIAETTARTREANIRDSTHVGCFFPSHGATGIGAQTATLLGSVDIIKI